MASPGARRVTCYLEKADGVHLAIKVVPRAGATRVEGVVDDVLRVRLAAAPVDGEANAALVLVLAAWLGVPRSSVSILRGDRSKLKVVRLAGAPKEIASALEKALANLG